MTAKIYRIGRDKAGGVESTVVLREDADGTFHEVLTKIHSVDLGGGIALHFPNARLVDAPEPSESHLAWPLMTDGDECDQP